MSESQKTTAGVIAPEGVSGPEEFRRRVVARHRAHVNSGMAKLADLMGTHVEVRSESNYVFDERGERHLDCGGYGVFTLGHCHPEVVAAVREQLERHPVATRALVNAEVAEAAEALASVTPRGLDYVYFAGSGTEATEAALKLACLNGRRKLVSMRNGYHGKTLGALAVTGRDAYRAPFRSLLAPADFVTFGDAESLREALGRHGDEACVILEPVQAEGGVIVPPDGYLREVERMCREAGAFLVLDEIQTGLGRLGAWWGADREGVTPDVLLVGKALGGGVLPVSAAVASAAVYEGLNRDPLLHTSTFSGSPLAAAAVTAAVGVFRREEVAARARSLGARIFPEVREIFARNCPALVREVRGLGLLLGVEFEAEHLAGDFLFEMLSRRVIVSYSLNAHRVARLTPPALLTDADVEWLLEAVRATSLVLAERYPNFAAGKEH
ncbi:MAG TPA: aminotransferase class III-fold pyridoxal phosphate-dependent enzyme [Pyrinomonadaceae bacterium]|jgi:putrescine aminotransferase|nr:aminotransferase class III-fold pyridoxal phosphate-dependent enzyme [Pyrinomonadaceae bacterium]